MKYNWCGYYRKAYERKKKENIVLAGKVADAEGKREELQAKYAAICANPLYKMTRPFYLVKRGCGRIVRKAEQALQGGGGVFSREALRKGEDGFLKEADNMRLVRGDLSKEAGNVRVRGDAFSEETGNVRFREERSTEKATPEKLSASYRERLAFQRESYSQWIREVEPVLWRQCEEDLRIERSGTWEGGHRRCLVVSYQELADITDLEQVLGNRKENNDTEGGNFDKGEPGNRGSEPDILLLAEDPEDLDEKAVLYIENWFTVHPETKLFYGAEDHRYVCDRGMNRGDEDGGKESVEKAEKRYFPWFKPCWSTDTLLGFFYFGSYFAVDLAWAKEVKLSGYADAKQNLYDFAFRLLKPYFTLQKEHKLNIDRKMTDNPAFFDRGNSDLPSDNTFCKNSISTPESIINTFSFESGGDAENVLSSERVLASDIVCADLILYHRSGGAVTDIIPDMEYFLHTGEMDRSYNPEFWGYEREYTPIKQEFLDNICYAKKREKNGGDLKYHAFCYQTLHPEVWSVAPEIDAEIEKTAGILVSVVIPSKDHPELLKKCIGSFLERTSLSEIQRTVEFIVVDNGSKEENRQTIQAFLESVEVECHYIYRPMPFNFSAMCNIGAAQAKGEYILLLNDDMEIIEENWLRILLGQALLPGTGAVGAKLWYPEEERIQHAGITNMHIGPSHKLVTFPDDRIYYYGHNAVTYDMIAVTAACLLVRRLIYREVGGMDEDMAVSYNDVDFCFRTAEAGYRNVVRNDAVLLHHESASRGLDELSSEKWIRLLREKEKLYKKHPLFYKRDPYYSEQLADDAPDYRIGYQYPYERRLLTAEPVRQEGKGKLQKMLSGMVMLTVERTGDQHKIHLNEPDILETEGWCYMLDQDNCLFERWLILESVQGDFYYQVPVRERLRPDVEAILPRQINIELSGFTCRILKESIAAGDYGVGMLYRNVLNGRLFYRRSDKGLKC